MAVAKGNVWFILLSVKVHFSFFSKLHLLPPPSSKPLGELKEELWLFFHACVNTNIRIY